MKTRIALVICLFLMVLPIVGRSEIITVRTGQANGVPGSCPGLDDTFHYYSPNPNCGEAILPEPFQASDFDHACSGPLALLVDIVDGWWTPNLPSDPLARWINWTRSDCSAYPPQSVLFCTPFQVHAECALADSVRIYWAVDDALGDYWDTPLGPNPDGVYIDGVSIGSAFRGPGIFVEHTAVVYNVPINAGSHHLQVYSRDTACGDSGLILSCTIYISCGSVPVRELTWGSIKSMYR